MFSFMVSVLNVFLSFNMVNLAALKKPENEIIRHQLNDEQFRSLIQSKTFFAECYAYQHPVFQSIKYSISYNDDKSFKETLYLFAKADCKGSLTLLESEGSYSLGSQIEGELPTREVDYKYINTDLRLYNPTIRKQLAETYRDSDCKINLKNFYDNFSMKKQSCFGFNLQGTAQVEFDIIGLATDIHGNNLYLYGGLKGNIDPEKKLRPQSLNYSEKLL